MRVRHLERISAMAAAEWDRFFPAAYPFSRHAFLDALEFSGSVRPQTGWRPHHAVFEDDQGDVVAVAPLYVKSHSYGEFVFDFSWADASSRQIGRPYYPKLLTAIPFTPATGPRLGLIDPQHRSAVIEALLGVAEDSGLSSYHALFLGSDDAAGFDQASCIARTDVQFHWHNRSYPDFTAFISSFTSEKRKKLLRERRRIAEAGLHFETIPGNQLDEASWLRVYALYSNTYEERGQSPYLTLEFFLDYGRQPDTPVRLVLCYEDQTMVAVAITIAGGDTLYGRHWGAADRYHSLHFETCYYQGIEYCIREGLQTFDAGAQGEHKLSRGFVPVTTRSAHWLADPRLREAVDHAMARERQFVDLRSEALDSHAPYRRDDATVSQD
jgi:predicted N-acyltransferase